MNDYQQEQWDALLTARHALSSLSPEERNAIEIELHPYLQFRQEVDGFLEKYMSTRCTANCYENRRSACCSKDGIVTFWADVVINALCSMADELVDLTHALKGPVYDYKCTYLGRRGCRWRVRPLGCAMFLCDEVQSDLFADAGGTLQDQWHAYVKTAKGFRWPDKPVLFDWIELFFLERGCRSPLMYINTSPGLLRVKQQAGMDTGGYK